MISTPVGHRQRRADHPVARKSVQVMFEASARGTMKEANSTAACWLGKLDGASDAGGTPAVRIRGYPRPPSTRGASAPPRTLPPARVATFLKPAFFPQFVGLPG